MRMHAIALSTLLLANATSVLGSPQHAEQCVDGMAEGHACNDVDMLAHLDLVALGASESGSDMWGWTDPLTGHEYALVGLDNGTAFVDISDPEHPLRLGNLPTHSSNSLWRDIKTFGDFAFIVSEASSHGMQVFDLTRLRDVANPPVTFSEDAWYGEILRAHNLVIDEQSGYAFAVGSRQGPQQCNSGLHMIDIHDPLNPTFAGCFSEDGYTHDAQCIVYDGPDSTYAGHEICFAANEDTLTIVDVEDKDNPVQLARIGYAGSAYTHQGWLTADRRYFLLDDELDEINFGGNTRTYVWDVQDLDAPQLRFTYTGPVPSSDHNLYIHDGFAYMSNYNSGLRILDLSNIDNGSLEEVAFFDTYPEDDQPGFDGTWSNYPFYASGVVAVSDITHGLFVLQPHPCRAPDPVGSLVAQAAGDNQINLSWAASGSTGATYRVERTLGGCSGGATETIAEALTQTSFNDATASGAVPYGYRVRAVAASGQCASEPGDCVEAATTGICTAAPAFNGVASADSTGTKTCGIDLEWQPAQSWCGSAVAYKVYRSVEPEFIPAPGNLIAEGVSTQAYTDTSIAPRTSYSYVVRAADSGNGNEDQNLTRLRTQAVGPNADGEWLSGAEIGDPILSGDTTTLNPFGEDDHRPKHVAWEVVDTVAHSGERSYYSGYNNLECLGLSSAPIELTTGSASMLEFWTRYGIEQGWDGGLVQVSINNGQTWQAIAPIGGYPATIDDNGNACGFPAGTGAFTGYALEWELQQFDLAPFAGQSVRLRWLFSTDGSVAEDGWWIDDIRLTHAQVPGMCSAGIDFIFADGFELP